MWDLAVLLEKHGQVGLLTTNMHACAVHMMASEARSGPLYRRKELYNERFIGAIKDGVTGRISACPEKVQARQWILKEGRCVFPFLQPCCYMYAQQHQRHYLDRLSSGDT